MATERPTNETERPLGPKNFGEKYQEYAKDPNLPFFNRAAGGAFHPGSTFKLVTSIAGIETGVLTEDFKYKDEGFVEAGGTRFRNWLYTRSGGTEGEINVVRAIARSTDTFFYIAGEKIGIDKLAQWAQKLGLGKITGIDLPHEAAGLVPTPDWKQRAKGERWFLGNTYNTSIGQGDVTATPLQINQLTGIVANGGKLCRPHVVKVGKVEKVEECEDLGISAEALRLTREGMIGACADGGTSGQFLNFSQRTACKTGTAETGTGTTHAWFTAFAPVENPQIAATVIIEEGGEGSVVAAPVVKKVFEEWFSGM